MQVKKNKTAVAIALILIITMVASMIVMPAVAQPGRKVTTYLLVSAAPQPVGVGQTVYINAFMSKCTPTASGAAGDRYDNMTVEITRPDGTKEKFGPYEADPTGGIWFSYVPAKTGNYTVQAFYPGQILTGRSRAYPAANGTNLFMVGSEVLPSESAKLAFTVQEEQVAPIYHSPPLPTEYWSRPIHATNYAWAELGGNWYGLRAASFHVSGMYDATGNFQPHSKAPNTAHVLWTKPTKFGGQVGAPFNADQESHYTSTSILFNHFEPIILYGILYYTLQPDIPQNIPSWVAVDLRTGQEIWKRSSGTTGDERLRMGQVMKFHTRQEYGSYAFLWSIPRTGTLVLRLYDAMTGSYLAEVTNGTNVEYLLDFEATEQGTILAHYTSTNATGTFLNMWNSTQMLAYPTGFPATGIHAATIRPWGTYNWTAGLWKTAEGTGGWTVPIPTTLANNTISLSVAARTPEVILLRFAPTPAAFVFLADGFQITMGINAKTGATLWGPINQTIPVGREIGLLSARDGVYVLHDKDVNEAYGYSLENGKLLWGPVKLPGNAWSHISRGGQIAYGNVYIWDFGGYVNCLDKDTGKIKWTFTPRSSGYDAPYGIYPLWHFGTHSIADGKIFLSEGSMYNPPLHPAYRLCINATTGELVWKILSYSGRTVGAVAEGMLVQWNSLDCQIYCFGKGQTATTVAASPKISVQGSSVLVEGMVTDESPGTKHSDRIARFPHGVPAVADESMSDWMEYVYMQQPKPANAKGVKVTITVLDPNGNSYDVATATSDANGFYSVTFEPPVPGKYTVIATFAGSESYWPSQAQTAINVEEAPQPTPAPTPTPAPMTDTYVLGFGTAMLIAIVIGFALLLLLRKR